MRTQKQSSPRIALIDILRGLAIVAMVIYHLAWDLFYYGFSSVDVTQNLGWLIFQRGIVGTFLFVTGFSLYLAHRRGIRWEAFWKRFAIIIAAALIVSAATFYFNSETFVYFGILHAIAIFSLAGLLLLRFPAFVNILIAVVFLVLPLFMGFEIFGQKPLSPVGLWITPPPSEDLVPFFPWFGMVALGLAVAQVFENSGTLANLARITVHGGISQFLSLLGRFSLPIYLVHQPILMGILFALSSIFVPVDPQIKLLSDEFAGSCYSSCVDNAGAPAYCTAYCGCALERVVGENLWEVLANTNRTADEDTYLASITGQCAGQAIDLVPAPANP